MVVAYWYAVSRFKVLLCLIDGIVSLMMMLWLLLLVLCDDGVE